MTLEEELERARKCVENPPPNERSTCEWVIVPLLERIGYSRHEIVPEESLPGRKRPDYTILPGTPHTWYVEAKQWSRDLDNDTDLVVQVANYAHAEGRRWVVLTNGREWRLYDDHIQGVAAADRLVARARLECEGEIEAFLRSCSRDSVTSGGLERYAAEQRLARALDEQLARSDSDVVKAICSALRRSGVEARAADVVRCLACRTESVAPAAPEFTAARAPDPPTVALVPAAERTLTLQQWYQAVEREGHRCLQRTKPTSVSFVGASPIRTQSWKDAVLAIVADVLSRGGGVREPYDGGLGPNCWFLNVAPVHPSGERMSGHGKVRLADRDVYVYTFLVQHTHIAVLHRLCRDAGVDPSSITITVR